MNMRRVVYWQKAERLVYLHEKATPEFWDRRWQVAGKPPEINPRNEVVKVTRKYLAAGSRILEGGCGRGNKVKAMTEAGFNAIGIDFAENSIRQARLDYPDLDIRHGDVRVLDFPDCFFDGYWSFGVIEHFFAGYDKILAEMVRVLKPGGFLFLVAPWFSPYRMSKQRGDGYPREDFLAEPKDFYQFALGRDEVCAELRRHGFELIGWHGRASEISMREDMIVLKSQINWLFDSRGSIAKRVFRRVVTAALNPYCGHSFLAIAKRKS